MLRNLDFRPHSEPRTSSPATARRGLRWTVLFSVPVFLLVSLLFAIQSPPSADAASPNTYVDCSGGAQTPNFPTIQEAVSNTAQSGVVHICTGAYSESVNLALMNGGDDAGNEGNITVLAEDGPGTVQIAPLVGSAFYISIAVFSGDITLVGLDVTSGDSAAINFADSKTVSGTATLSGVVAHNAGGGSAGAKIYASVGVQIINSQAISNDGPGFDLYSGGELRVDGSVAQYNGQNLLSPFAEGSGFQVNDYLFSFPGCLVPAPRFEFANTTASDNLGYGIRADLSHHDFFVDTVNAHRNYYDGVDASTTGSGCPQNFVVTNSNTDDNGVPGSQYHGICLYSPDGTVSIQDSSAQNNKASGIAAWSGCRRFSGSSPELISEASRVNAPAAPTLSPGQVMITNSSGISNVADGFLVDYAEIVTMTNISALRNAEQGVNFIFASASLDAVAQLDTSLTKIADSLIVDNQGHGVQYDLPTPPRPPQAGAPSDILSATQFVNGSIICNNIQGGVVITDVREIEDAPAAPELFTVPPLEVNATANWWGSNSGPAHPSNSTPGAGDAVHDTSNGFTGTVYFNPWIDQIAGTATPNPTLLGIPVNVNFQFSGDAQSVFLGQGVGNLNDPPPFTVSTDNGAVEGNNPISPTAPTAAASGPSITQFIGPANGLLPVTLTPTSARQANVTLQGPCDLNVQVPVLVASPSIVITKTPDSQTIPAGGTAAFSITVHNTGDITLTNLTVSDALAPDCDDTPGALAPGASTTYSCAVEPDDSFTNVAVASGTPLITPEQPLQPVTDTDSAEVVVAPLSISLLKTAAKLGATPSCPAPATLTVEQGDVVEYCYTVTNTGAFTLSTHSLVDDMLGVLLTDAPFELAPGASVSTFALGEVITTSLSVTTTNIATWTGSVDAAISANSASVTASNVATVNVQETPTAIDPDVQPLLPRRIFVPSLSR